LKFPENFLWGVATSAYQVEGGIENCNWSENFPAGKASDHYHRYQEDFDLLKSLNLNAYRFSIEWSRIEPRCGEFDAGAIEHYWKVLHSLKSRRIKTMVTLFHFTLPLWLSKRGGMSSSKFVFYFTRFAQRMFDQYADLVDFWITFNEPLNWATIAYLEGRWPPHQKNPLLFFKVLRNQILAHKKIYFAFHRSRKCPVEVGISKLNQHFEPFHSRSPLDRAGVWLANYFWNEFFLNRIKNQLDFIGLAYYFHHKIKFPARIIKDKKPVSDLGWVIYPEGIYHLLKSLKKYKKPIYITENGLADSKDKFRANFIKEHLIWIHRAIQEGIDCRGYFHWSLIDNFEWEKGFGPRFGLVEVDFESLERKPRPSALFYAKIAKENQITLNSS